MHRTLRYDVLFFIVLLLQFALYDYFILIDELPLSVHMWRQSDCLSFTMSFFNHGMDITAPQVNHMLSGEGYTVGEFPLMYYLVAALYHIFGPEEWVYRSVWMATWCFGMFAFYRSILLFLKDPFWAIALSALMFSSPVLVFYANSFIIDPVALSISLMAWYCFARYWHTSQKKWLIIAIIGFSFAGLFKEPSLLTYMALVFILLLKEFETPSAKKTSWKKMLARSWFWLVPILAITCWYFIKRNYNLVHFNAVFLAEIVPIWQLSAEHITSISQHIEQTWLKDYFGNTMLLITATVFVINLYFIKSNKWPTLFMLLLFLGSCAYVLLFYKQFRNHDYYIISMLPLIPVVWLVFVKRMEKWTMGKTKWGYAIKMVFTVLVVCNVWYASNRQQRRYTVLDGWMIPDREKVHHLKEAADYLTEIGIKLDDKIISIPDETLNLTLYLLNRQGWNSLGGNNTTTESILKHAERGAKVLVVNDSAELSKPYLQPFLAHRIGVYKGIYVFGLPN
jgi:hypothetical protein